MMCGLRLKQRLIKHRLLESAGPRLYDVNGRAGRVLRIHERRLFMFDMNKVGQRIAQIRKQRDMTQMELADRLNISFQAVSNWERGQSMPDIAKLGEISELLDTPIDILLDNERGARVIQSIQSDQLLDEPVSGEELLEIAPLLKPTELNRAVSELKKRVDLSEVSGLLPFLNDSMIDEIAWDCYRINGLTNDMSPLGPFLKEKTLDALVKAAIKDGKDLSALAAFYPFLSDDTLRTHANTLMERTGDLSVIAPVAPFLDGDVLDDLARRALAKDGLKALSPIMPFIDESVVEEYLRQKKPYFKNNEE